MEALILCAGDGTRLSPLTKDKPKVMIKICGVPILERSLHVLRNVGVKKVVIIIGYKGEIIRRYFGDEWNSMKIIYRETNWYGDGILKSVIKGKDAINDRFILLCGDTIPEEESLRSALEKDGHVVIGVRKEIKDDSVVAEISADGVVIDIGMRGSLKKFNATVAGISINDPIFFDAVEECIKNGKFDRPDAVKWMIEKGYKVNSFSISNDTFLDIDNFEDLKEAEKIIFESAVKQRIKNPGMFKKLFNFPISLPLTKLLVGTNITPNQVTLMSLLLAITAGLLFSSHYYIIGGIICYLSAMLDAVDGKISRLKFKDSPYGKFFDSLADRLSELSIIIGLTIGVYLSTHNYFIFLLGLLGVFFTVGRFYLNEMYYHLTSKEVQNVWRGSKLSKLVELANRDLTFLIILLSCFFYPIIGLSYLAFSAFIAFSIRTYQALNTL